MTTCSLEDLKSELEELACEGHESLRGDAMGLTIYCPDDECVAAKRRALRRKILNALPDDSDPAERTIEYYRQA